MPFEVILKYPAALFSGLVVSLLLTRVWVFCAARWGFVDRPGGRKMHRKPVPTAGGIAVFLAFHAACAVAFLPPWLPFAGQVPIEWWYRFIPLSAGIVLLGLVDDLISLKPVVKLSGQILLALAAYYSGIRIQNVLGAELSPMLDFLATLFWFLLLINAFNLIDGIDGLAVGIALIASLGVGLSLVFRKEPGDVLLFAGFAGACAGFLRYNFHPARVFLGDTGSQFLGFALASLAISTSSKGPAVAAIGMPLLAVGVPLFDTLLAVWRRTVRRMLPRGGQGIQRADADHLHHRLLRRAGGRKHSEVALVLYAATTGLAVLGIMVSVFHDRALGILALAFLLGSYTVVRHLAWIELGETGEAVLRGIRLPVRRNRTLLFYLAGDLAILSLALLAALLLTGYPVSPPTVDLKNLWLRSAPLDVGLPFVFLIFFRSYSRVWYLARVSEYIGVGLAVFSGYIAAFAVQLIGSGVTGAAMIPLVNHYFLLSALATPLVVLSRSFLRLVADLRHWAASGSRRDEGGAVRVLVCGAGQRAVLFLQQLVAGYGGRQPHIVGMVAADDAIRGHFVHGVRVLGNFSDLPALLKNKIDLIYVVEDLAAEDEKRLLAAAQASSGVRVIRWRIVESDMAAPGGIL